MSKNYVLTSSNQQGLEQPLYFEKFSDMYEYVINEIRNNLIDNDETYKTIMDLDTTLYNHYKWEHPDDFENTYIVIDNERLHVKAKTSSLNYYGLEFIGEKIPNDKN